MTESASFADIILTEAVGQRLRVDLVLKAVTPTTDTRLISRFLGFSDENGLVLAVPWTSKNEKVFIPLWWDMGMAFELGDLWVQTRSEVVGHCQFPVGPNRRIDALVVTQPGRILSLRAGRKRRHEVDTSTPVEATVWAGEDSETPDVCESYGGQLVNWSEGGLCVRLSCSPRFQVGGVLFVRLKTPCDKQFSLLQGSVKHCTAEPGGVWRVGLGDVHEITRGRSELFKGQFLRPGVHAQ